MPVKHIAYLNLILTSVDVAPSLTSKTAGEERDAPSTGKIMPPAKKNLGPVVVNGKLAVQLENEEMEEQTKDRRNALILYTMGNTPNYNYMMNYELPSEIVLNHQADYFLRRKCVKYGHVCRGDNKRDNTQLSRTDQPVEKQVMQNKGAQRGRRIVQQWQSKYPAPNGQEEAVIPPPRVDTINNKTMIPKQTDAKLIQSFPKSSEVYSTTLQKTMASSATPLSGRMGITVVYGSNCSVKRQTLWAGSSNIGSTMNDPFCLCGDFNTPLLPEDRIGGQPVADAETRDFSSLWILLL
ncbi:hypothetical protein HAX54_031095 [Datura stramonium]|uniref:Uncharacterized protein n=1 Tax=Datura stramonium TaxID=4076 RepID=A0ABS8VAZ9_DATST|nr:hypothetical protein [Datura stramonium]